MVIHLVAWSAKAHFPLASEGIRCCDTGLCGKLPATWFIKYRALEAGAAQTARKRGRRWSIAMTDGPHLPLDCQ